MSLAPAATRDGFAFAGDLYAETSGGNRHRRATVAELKEHFKSGSDKDHPAHWFEAQLIHYGLPVSKTKSVARMRLFDAVNANKISVPSHVKSLEADLKTEWVKKEREAKKALNNMTTTTTSAAAGKKRKAESSNVDLAVNVGGINITVSANNTSSSSTTATAAKKAKTSTTATSKAAKDSPKPTTKKAPASKPKPAKKSPALKPKPATTTTSKAKPAAAAAPSSSATTSSTPAKKQTARRGGISQGPSRGGSTSTSTPARASANPPLRGNQARRRGNQARRSGAFVARGRGTIPVVLDFEDDEPPPPYSEWNDHQSDNSNPSSSPPLPPLGLLNGRYDISSNEVEDQWDITSFSLVLTISGRELWGKFDLGVVSGIMHFADRPMRSSYDCMPFTWRGAETDGPIWYGNNNHGWIRFLGDGCIEGELDYMSLEFGGERLPGQGTRSEIDAQTMWSEWDGYTEQEYERLNRARW